MKKILVIGSICLENVLYTDSSDQAQENEQPDNHLTNIAGKGANQAASIHFLGGDVTFYGAIGKDENGKRVKTFLDTIGVRNNLKLSSEDTGVASIIVDANGLRSSEVIVPGANMDVTPEDIDKIDFSQYDYLLMQLENPIDTVVYAMKKARDNGLVVCLNPAPYRKLPLEAYPLIDFFIPNEKELNEFTKECEGDMEQKIIYLLNAGVKRVVVTLGERGSYFADSEQSFLMPSFKVKTVDKSGAGDCYCGSFVTALSIDRTIRDSMEFASKASSLVVTKKGAIAALPHLEDMR